jgi:Family of unknown function (DUF5670)
LCRTHCAAREHSADVEPNPEFNNLPAAPACILSRIRQKILQPQVCFHVPKVEFYVLPFWRLDCVVEPDGEDVQPEGGIAMLMTIFVILLVLWLLGMVTSYTLFGYIHILLVIAVAVLLIRVIQGRNPL